MPLVGGLPFCPACREGLYKRTLPKWLSLSMAGLLALLAVALLHGRKFFQAEKSLILADRLVAKHQYSVAIPLLKDVVGTGPNCEKCILLLAKAELLTGDSESAFKLIQSHNGAVFQPSNLTSEVQGIATRVGQAFQKYQQGVDFERKGQWEEGARKMREAARDYPEQPELAYAAESSEETVAFEAKDYDQFLKLAEGNWSRGPQTSLRAGAVASALACKYVVTGEEQMKARAEEMLERARTLSKDSPTEAKAFKEFEERIAYRLRAREIIDTDEYNRRFRPQLATGKKE